LQIPLRTSATVEDYVARQEWRDAHLSCCPLHPRSGCSFRRHGSYARLTSPGVRIARWYCPQGRMTFSLLPDFLAARLPGQLSTIERAVMVIATARSMEAAADALRGPEIGLPGAVRWLRRRVMAMRRSITAVKLMAPDVLERAARGDDTPILPKLRRALPSSTLNDLPVPLGFASMAIGDDCSMHMVSGIASPDGDHQHDAGPDGISAASYPGSVKVTGCSPCRPNQPSRPPPRIFTVFGALTAA
jgi:hypothetical protein